MRLKTLSLLLSFAAATVLSAAEPSLRGRGPLAREARTVIVHPLRPLTPADKAELADEGVHIHDVLTGGRYLARVVDDANVTDARIDRIEPLTPEMKIHRSAYRAVAAGKSSFRVHVKFQRGVDFDSARSAILAAGGAIDPLKVSFAPSRRIDATIPSSSLEALAADERVLVVAAVRNWKLQSENATTAQISHVTEVHQAPYDLTGEGVTVSLFELARGQADHVEFGDRFTTATTGGGSSDALHATHVGGTMIAAGVNPEAKGMAPRARLHQFCVGTPCGGDLTYLEDKDALLSTLGVTADNNSWGFVLGWSSEGGYPVWNDAEEYFGAYDTWSAGAIDEISLERDILFVHSAGNEGQGQVFNDEFSEHRHVDENFETITDKLFCYSRNGKGDDCAAGCNGGCEITRHMAGIPFDTIGVTAAAKNVLTVGNLIADSPATITLASSSSRGPAKDGRVKPDVVARGTRVLSTVPGNGYQKLSGTSMAAPAVTGIAALLTEQWRRTFGGDPGAAHLKAVIIAGAQDLGNAGPDYSYGFGLVNAKASVDIIRADGGQASRIRDLTVGQGQTLELPVLVEATQPFRAVLHWADPAIVQLGGDGIAEKALVNDLDVRVVDPSGTEHRPYVLDKAAPTASATRGRNSVDNTEMLEIASATPGVYRVIVSGTAVSKGPQDAVLITTGRGVAPCRDAQELAAGSNDTAETAHGNLVPGQTVNGGLCAAGDVDFYRLNVTKSGPISVVVSTGDTPLRVTLSGAVADAAHDVAANSTATLTANAASPGVVFVRVEAAGAVGPEPQYSFVPQFGQELQPRRRAAGR